MGIANIDENTLGIAVLLTGTAIDAVATACRGKFNKTPNLPLEQQPKKRLAGGKVAGNALLTGAAAGYFSWFAQEKVWSAGFRLRSHLGL